MVSDDTLLLLVLGAIAICLVAVTFSAFDHGRLIRLNNRSKS